jgi:UDP:flavonoid glycosyltransferase YjiC (YdhE family)
MTRAGTQQPRIAVAHCCEGAGHATRMLAVVERLEAAGYETVMAGGGPGTRFVEKNGHTEYEPAAVEFIDDFQNGGLFDVVRNSGPALYSRVQQYRAWYRAQSPALILADGIPAAIAAAADGRDYVYVSHDPAAFYENRVERLGAVVRNRLAMRTAERFLLPKVWEGEPTIPGAEVIGPLAPEGDAAPADVDVLLVPSAFSIDPERLAAALRARGREVTLVGGEDWETAPTLQPYIEGANLVVCNGYSTVMEAAVAGTPCLVLPTTSEQHGVADALSETRGFYAATSLDGVESLLDRVESPRPQPNGAERAAEVVADYADGKRLVR